MFYESRMHNITDLTNETIEKQAESIEGLGIGRAIKIGNVLWVNDENPSGTGGHEAAVLYQFPDRIVQFESVTIGWCSLEKIMGYIKEYSNTDILKKEYLIEKRRAIKFNDQNALSWFTCGCCGTGFKSTVATQKVFGQDAGYGICSGCEQY